MKTKSLALWLTTLGPLALVAAGIAYGAWQELRAWRQVRQAVLAEVSQAKREDPLRLARQALAGEEQAADVRQIELMAIALRDQAQSYDLSSIALSAPLAAPGDADAWPEAPLVDKLMADAEPVFEKLEQLLGAREDSDYLALGLSYSHVHELLETSFRHSVFSDDSEGAERALTLMAQLTIFDTAELNANSQIHYLPRYLRLYQLLGWSLAHDPWSAQQLQRFANLILKPLDISERLQASRRHHQRVALSWMLQEHGADLVDPSRFEWSSSTDSVYLLRVLEALRRPDGISGVNDLNKSIQLLERPLEVRRAGAFAITAPYGGGQSYAGPVLQQTPKLAFALAKVEDSRRIVSLAVAVKLFQLEHQRWPRSLDELADEEQDRKLAITEGRRFDYAVTSDAVTSDEANSDMPQYVVLRQVTSAFREAWRGPPSTQLQLGLRDLPSLPDVSWLLIR